MPANPAPPTLPHLQYRWVFAASLLLSAWLIWLDPLINRDAIIYLRAADAYLQQGFAASQQLHDRPLLSICMALLHQLSGLSLLQAGLLITTLCYAVLCTTFVATLHILGGDRAVQLIGALVILSHPWLNHLRSAIMRDPAYWALLLLSLREMLRYLRRPTGGGQLRWLGYILLASLFRFEGLFFAALAPLALLFTRNLENPLRRSLQLLLPQLLVIGLALLALLYYQGRQEAGGPLFPAIAYYLEQLRGFPAEFRQLAQAAAEPMLRFTAREDAELAVVAGLLAVLLVNICRALSWPWLLTLVWGLRDGPVQRLRPDDRAILAAHMLIALTYLALFALINRFMLERYANQLVILLLLLLPFVLSALWHRGGWRKWLTVLLLAGMAADTLHNGDREKRFVAEATAWVADHTPADASLVTNEKYIAYFSGRDVDWTALQGKRFVLEEILASPRVWRRKDYLVVYLRPRKEATWQAFLAASGLGEERSFGGSGPKGRVAVVNLRGASGRRPAGVN